MLLIMTGRDYPRLLYLTTLQCAYLVVRPDISIQRWSIVAWVANWFHKFEDTRVRFCRRRVSFRDLMESQSLRNILWHGALSRTNVNRIWDRQANSQQIYEPAVSSSPLGRRNEREEKKKKRKKAVGGEITHLFSGQGISPRHPEWNSWKREDCYDPLENIRLFARRYRLDPAKSTGIKRPGALKERETQGPIYPAAFQIRRRGDYLLARIFREIVTDFGFWPYI